MDGATYLTRDELRSALATARPAPGEVVFGGDAPDAWIF